MSVMTSPDLCFVSNFMVMTLVVMTFLADFQTIKLIATSVVVTTLPAYFQLHCDVSSADNIASLFSTSL